MKRETNQDEFRQTIAPPIEGEKERAKAAMILSTVYANHTGGKSIPSSKNAFKKRRRIAFPFWSLCSSRTARDETTKRLKVHSPKMKNF